MNLVQCDYIKINNLFLQFFHHFIEYGISSKTSVNCYEKQINQQADFQHLDRQVYHRKLRAVAENSFSPSN